MFSLYGLPISIYLIAITSCMLFLANQKYWLAGMFATIAAALVEGQLGLVSLVWLGLLSSLLYAYQTRGKLDWLLLTLSILLGVALGMHVLPGFNNIQYLESVQLSKSSAPFDVWFNYDKALFGVLVLGIVLWPSLNQSFSDWRAMFLIALPILLVGLATTYSVGLLLGYSHIRLDLDAVFWPWVFKNLFFTVIAEEALFRGLIQRHLARHFSAIASVFIAALLFGFAHIAGGWQYVLLSSVAGLMYGYCYLKTGRIEAAIFAHLMLNVVHFIFFAYPYALNV